MQSIYVAPIYCVLYDPLTTISVFSGYTIELPQIITLEIILLN